MSLVGDFFQKVDSGIENDRIIKQFNERAKTQTSLDNAAHTKQQLIEELDGVRRRGQLTRLQYEDALQRLQSSEAARSELYRTVKTMLMGILFFLFVLMTLLIASGIL